MKENYFNSLLKNITGDYVDIIRYYMKLEKKQVDIGTENVRKFGKI